MDLKLNYLYTNREPVWCKLKAIFEQKNFKPTVKPEAVNVMVWVWGRAWSTLHHRIRHEFFTISEAVWGNVRPSVQKLKLKQRWTMQHDNDQKHSSKSTKKLLKRKKKKKQLSQSPDLNPVEKLWSDLKRAQTSDRFCSKFLKKSSFLPVG